MGEQRGNGGGPLPDRPHKEQSSLEALRAHQLADEAGHETPGMVGRPTEGVVVQVCVECGKHYHFDDADPPAEMTCDKCGNTVFRTFFDASRPDDVDEDFRQSTERDTDTDDGPDDVTRSDVMDLQNP